MPTFVVQGATLARLMGGALGAQGRASGERIGT